MTLLYTLYYEVLFILLDMMEHFAHPILVQKEKIKLIWSFYTLLLGSDWLIRSFYTQLLVSNWFSDITSVASITLFGNDGV